MKLIEHNPEEPLRDLAWRLDRSMSDKGLDPEVDREPAPISGSAPHRCRFTSTTNRHAAKAASPCPQGRAFGRIGRPLWVDLSRPLVAARMAGIGTEASSPFQPGWSALGPTADLCLSRSNTFGR